MDSLDYQSLTTNILSNTFYETANSDFGYNVARNYNLKTTSRNLLMDIGNNGEGEGPNTTFNYDTITTTTTTARISDMSDNYELFQDYSEGLLTFASISCIIFILIGVPGNLITIIALAKCRKVRNATAAFIINLSLSDLLFCCFNLPLAASTFWRRSWTHGNTLCRLYPLMRYGLLAVSDFTVLAITINRYVMIGHPRIYQRIYRRWHLGVMVISIWVSAFLSLIPTWRGIWGQFGLDKEIGSCTILPDSNGVTPKEFFFVMAFIVPCIFIIVCYARIFYIVRKTAMKSHDPVLSANSVRILNKSQQSLNKENEQNLLVKGSKTSKEESSSSSATSGGCNGDTGYQSSLLTSLQNETNSFPKENLEQQQQQSVPLIRPYLTKIRDDDLKYIDTSVESLNPPQHVHNNSILYKYWKKNDDIQTVIESINENVNEDMKNEIKKPTNVEMNSYRNDDSAYETVTHSLINNNSNNVYHITNNDNEHCNQIMPIHIEPSSTSGVGELPLDSPEKNPKKRRFLRKSIQNSINNMTSRKYSRKSSSNLMNNTSAASVLYPGRMSQKDRRLLKMILVIFLSFVICYLPITITKIWKNVTKIHVVNIMGYLLIYLTTCINPIIYVVMSSEYRQAYWNLLLCRTNMPGRTGGGGVGMIGRRASAPSILAKRKNSKPNIGNNQRT